MAYDWKVTAKKVAVDGAIVLVAGLIAVYGENPAYLALVPLAKGILNYLRHKDD